MTKRENFKATLTVLETVEGTEVEQAFITRELELLTRKSGKERGLTENQKDNEDLKGAILVILESEPMTATAVADFLNVNVQKATALLAQLVRDEFVVKTPAKGKVKATFAVA